MYLIRAFLVWLVIMSAESIHGTLRQFFLAPFIGDLPARRIAIFTGMLLIFLIAYFFIRWIGAQTTKSFLFAGLLWSLLTLAFEFGIGLFVLGYTRERMFEDYDISRGGLMGFGLAFMLITPYLAARLRGIIKNGRENF